MASTRLHHSLPAPVVHAGFSIPQSKSHVLAGVQDAYWSDDDAEDAECPLCLEEMDISDLNFKPCICGYQICRFCWHHIKENLNKRCPACRRIYTDDGVEFKPIATQDHKRLTQQKKQRDRERKDLEALGRKHLANVRVVQRNVVYVVGIGPRFAKEELIPTLRSNEYFGQYGKITKIILVKRNSPGGGGPVVGLYITYHRREDAARAISVVDGTPSPGGGRDIMRASYGTTKYCMAFLRGVSCSDHSCMNLHEWGDEKDCFTKEDLTTLKHTMKATETRTRTVTARRGDEEAGLPRAASWAQKGSVHSAAGNTSSTGASPNALSSATAARQPRRTGIRQTRNSASNDIRPSQAKSNIERKTNTASLSRPTTPAAAADSNRTESVADLQTKRKDPASPVPSSPLTLPAPSSEVVLEVKNTVSSPPSGPSERPPDDAASSSKSAETSSAPPGLTAPPGLAAPPGLPAPPGLFAPPSIPRPTPPIRAETESPQTPLLATQTSYQMSTAARALLDDVKARREAPVPSAPAFSPFPEFDRTLQNLSGEDGVAFSFNLDLRLAEDLDENAPLPDFDMHSNIPFQGSYIDAFPALRSGSPYIGSPSAGYSSVPSHAIYDATALRPATLDKSSTRTSGYNGSFNPFSDTSGEAVPSTSSTPSRIYSPVDEERKLSRFGFARGRQTSTATSSPLHTMSPLSFVSDHNQLYHGHDEPPTSRIHSWQQHTLDAHPPLPDSSSHHPPPLFMQNQGHIHTVNNVNLSEAELRNFILSSQDRVHDLNSSRQVPETQPFISRQQFEDPAIMSASFATVNDLHFQSAAFRPPPGLQRLTPPMGPQHRNNPPIDGRGTVPPVFNAVPGTMLTSEDFPALTQNPSDLTSAEPSTILHPLPPTKADEKVTRRAAKKAALVEKAIEKQRLAQEKADVKAAEKARKEAQQDRANEKGDESAPTAIPNKLRGSSSARPKPQVIPERPKSSSTGAPQSKPPVSKKQKVGTTSSAPLTVQTKDLADRPTPAPVPHNADILDTESQVPLLSKKPKKNKPVVVKPAKITKEEEGPESHETFEGVTMPAMQESPMLHGHATNSSSATSRAQSLEFGAKVTSVQTLLEQIDAMSPRMDLGDHPFFDVHKLTSPAKMPLEYGPLVHALSALSVGGGSFANNMPSGSIDNAVSSFQQLLETLTSTISDLLRLLPRTTWDDSSSFDGVLRDMLKGDDFLDDAGEDGHGKEDEVAALTLALERRARWMEVQLSKLEELHRDINTAAVKAVLSFGDSGWDRNNFLPRNGNTLARFTNIGIVEGNGVRRYMTSAELEKKLAVAKEAAVFAEAEIREAMERFHQSKH